MWGTNYPRWALMSITNRPGAGHPSGISACRLSLTPHRLREELNLPPTAREPNADNGFRRIPRRAEVARGEDESRRGAESVAGLRTLSGWESRQPVVLAAIHAHVTASVARTTPLATTDSARKGTNWARASRPVRFPTVRSNLLSCSTTRLSWSAFRCPRVQFRRCRPETPLRTCWVRRS